MMMKFLAIYWIGSIIAGITISWTIPCITIGGFQGLVMLCDLLKTMVGDDYRNTTWTLCMFPEGNEIHIDYDNPG
jgi:hypothetical protein